MLKDGVVLAVICLIVVGGIFAWWMQSSTHTWGAPVESQVQETGPPPTPDPPVVKKARIKAAPVLVAERSVVVEDFPSPVIPSPDPIVQSDPPPFPAGDQIATGAHEGSITSKYGDPALSAVTSSGGHMVETFVYARNRGRMATIIRLEDGKVSAAYSRSEPTLPSGLSAPRRWHNE